MKVIRNMKLSLKIGILSFSFLFFLLIIGVTSINQLSSVNNNVTELNNARLVPIVDLDSLRSEIEYIKAQGTSFMDAEDDEEQQKVIADIEKHEKTASKLIAKYKNEPGFKKISSTYKQFIAAKDSFIESNQTQKQGQEQNNSSKQELKAGPPTEMSNFDKARKSVISALNKQVTAEVTKASNTYQDSKSVYESTRLALIALVAFSMVIAILLSIFIIKSVVTPVNRVTAKLKEISQNNGDLTQRISYDSKDEIGELSSNFDLFMEKLHSIISEVADSSRIIASSSNQLTVSTGATTQSLEEFSNTIGQIAASTHEGAAAAEQTTATLEAVASFSESTANASRNTAEKSRKAKEAAEDGADKISNVVSSITDIAAASTDVTTMINELDQSSKKIKEIIQIITGISQQTNLLALNASIEAARAGEAGRGFSVVANEIRNLADQSNIAASEISELVKENQLKSESAVKSVLSVERKITDGVEKASQVGQSIQSIIQNIQDIVMQIEQIDIDNEKQADSMKEMKKAIADIATASSHIAGDTENISSSIQEQLATMTEIDRTTEQLSGMAKKLQNLTSGFKI
ncbi:methyl-accepting chemotaxis protein [Bacillus rubiinfantis]|uniref:methyl-accepting chemotaxis protein n=1 Tax=Bacillus rubiinfantis TaxID=1499680 RepID=UPI0005AB0AAF|nr:methyl-accepting chemotaxis protein [Bacillus rubiinfantis]